ncbi:ATP synthase subunit b' [Hibiscus syriacus]|uniref:ATP synthase subunit b n=1 Tax=Hibiscus syriacus TaxID=106335 RepID=A0A6A2XCZ6_HIBSY|nr:ATP synthase subunit b' [Hibiscus syriacus]
MLGLKVEENSSRKITSEKPSLSSTAVDNGSSWKTFHYSKLPEETFGLSIRKLDGSSFGAFTTSFLVHPKSYWLPLTSLFSFLPADVEVLKSANVADLKLEVQNVFDHMPNDGPDKISCLKSIYIFTLASLPIAPPSLAAEIEKATLFDFNLTLPIMMVQFLLLMFALDKAYFIQMGKFMDERDAAIKEKLSGVKDTSEEVNQLEKQANAIMRGARAEISAALNKMKKEAQLESETG